LTLGQIARALGATLEGDPDLRIAAVAPLETAGPDQIAFVTHPKYAALARSSRAGALLVPREGEFPGSLLRADNPRVALVGLLELLHPPSVPDGKVHASAEVAGSARVHPTATVGALAVIAAGAVIGERAWIFPFAYVGERAEIGADCVLYPHAVILERVKLGNRVIVHPGAVLGADGFGYVFDEGRHVKIPQVGRVVVEDDVEIGANTTIDRATVGDTVVRRGTKIDNLVQIAHNVEVGEDALLVAQVGIAGSSRIGNRVVLAGQAGVADHVIIGDGAVVGAQAGVPGNLQGGQQYWGTPARPAAEAKRIAAALPRVPGLVKQVRALERRVQELEARLGLSPPTPGEHGHD
jgi:UDP-3-O-[3-hydroxymyristoyl] glucosamine N-acyltransferase